MTKHKRRPNGPPGETLDEWGYRTARETGYDAGNLRGLCKRTWGIRITDETAKRWADEARRTGMKLLTYTDKSKPWRTTAGHTITAEPMPNNRTRYALSAPGWDHPVIVHSRAGYLAGIAALTPHLPSFSLYVDGVFADDEDPETDLLDDPKYVSSPTEEHEGEQVNAFDPIERPARRLAA